MTSKSSGMIVAMRILLATSNQGKVRELRDLLRDSRVELIGLGGLPAAEDIETGATFEENALLKARHYHRLSGLPTIADDSGLEVRALGGRPGIHSARYAGPQASDAERVAKLLEEAREVPDDERQARFVCAAAFVWRGGEQVFRAEAPGRLLRAPRGAGGFGYDPIFYYEPLGRTFAELTAAEKGEVSHRGLAFRRLAAWLEEAGLLDSAGSSDRMNVPAGETSASSD